jgi:Tol biopolymer transport system component
VRALLAVLLLGCHARLGGDAVDAAVPDGVDAPADAMVPLGPWSAPTMLPFSIAGDDDPSATGDLLELYFNRAQDIYVTTRASTSAAWGTPALVPELSVPMVNDTTPEVTYDGLTMYLGSARTPSLGATDIWMATRASRTAPWGTPVAVAELSSASSEQSSPTPDNLHITFESDRGGATTSVYAAERASATLPWGAPVGLAEINSAGANGNPMLSADRRELFFNSDRSGNAELWVATRATASGPFSAPALITELADPTLDNDPWISADDRTLMFTSDRGGTRRLWMTTR